MGEIRSYPWFRHLRSEPSFHVLRHRDGQLVGSGRGLSFWFLPMHTSIAELPMDDRDLPFVFHGRSRDYQEVTVQGLVRWRVVEPEVLAGRVDFAIDLASGDYLRQPLDQIATLLGGMAQQAALKHLAEAPLRDLLEEGPEELQRRIAAELVDHAVLAEMGLKVIAVRAGDLRPTADMEAALQTPMREKIQEAADKARFERRARAVEEERAIGENELQSKIELARKEELLIEQQGQNNRRQAVEEAEALRIGAEAGAARKKHEAEVQATVTHIQAAAEADRLRIETEAQAEKVRAGARAEAERIRAVDGERVTAERGRMDIYRDLPPAVLLGFAAQELAGKLKIEHLNITPDLLGPAVEKLLAAGARGLDRLGKG